MNLVDTSGWIEFLFGGENAGVFAPAIEDTASLVVPVICLYEVFRKVNAVADEAKALRTWPGPCAYFPPGFPAFSAGRAGSAMVS